MATTFDPGQLEDHLKRMVKYIREGRLIPFLGAGANLCDRLDGSSWSEKADYLPSGGELAERLAEKFFYPLPQPCPLDHQHCATRNLELDLARVAQFGGIMEGRGEVDHELSLLFGANYEPTTLHRLLASIEESPQPDRAENHHLLVVTTNYDDMMERAFHQLGKEFDLLFYFPGGQPPGRFWHKEPGDPPHAIAAPNVYDYPFCELRPLLLKIHGTVSRSTGGQEGFVITEDDYIEYLAEESLENLIPSTILAKLVSCHIAFFGYGLRDWNLRVFLRRMRKRWPYKVYEYWAVQRSVDEADRKFWLKNDVEIMPVPLEQYVAELGKRAARLLGNRDSPSAQGTIHG